MQASDKQTSGGQAARRRFLLGAPLAASALLLGAAQGKAVKERVIKVEARKFRFSPNVIEVRQGEAVVLELRALDFAHGFNIPELQTRIDLVPGKAVKLRLQLTQAGRFGFLCDNFCGAGHEEMAGTLVVTA